MTDKSSSIVKKNFDSAVDISRRSSSLKPVNAGSKGTTAGKKNVQIAKEKPPREKYAIIVAGKNVTPKPLNPLSYEKGKERQISLVDITDRAASKSFLEVQPVSHIFSEFAFSRKSATTIIHSTMESTLTFDTVFNVDGEEPFVVYTPVVKDEKMPEYVSVILKETSTEYIFELPSKTADKDTEEGNSVEEANKRYDFLTTGKGRNRKVINAEIQTVPILFKTRQTEKERVTNKSSYAFASGWDMFDTYSKTQAPDDEKEDKEFELIEAKKSVDSLAHSKEDKQFQKIVHNPHFFEACIVIERLLANNNFNAEQKRFRGLSDPEPFREDIEYKYRLNLLWTFSTEKTQGRCVTGLAWNPENRDILAVGYGKFYFATQTTGMVLIWNIKNPVQPERVFSFSDPVTCLNFSEQNPNLLAVGFYYGLIKVIDITSRTCVRIISQVPRDTFPTHEAIWQVFWISGDAYYKGVEQIVSLGQDGRVHKLRHSGGLYLTFQQIMRISSEGELKGIKLIRKCPAPGLPLNSFPGALVYAQHPTDGNVYFVGAANGVIHKCSKNFFHQHLDSFKAHDGPIKQLKFSPFCNKLMLTCGDDWYARVWLDSSWEPFVELKTTMQTVEGADWSPSHSTIIATIGGKEIILWDLQRKVYLPQSTTTSPTKCRNTVVQFTHDGRCLVVGDIEGFVHIFSLEDMPFPAFFQANLLAQSLKRALIIRPELLRILKKHGDLNFTEVKE